MSNCPLYIILAAGKNKQKLNCSKQHIFIRTDSPMTGPEVLVGGYPGGCGALLPHPGLPPDKPGQPEP